MSDYTKLIERLVKLPVSVQNWKAVCEIKEGIEALQGDIGSITSANMWLQAENERLKTENDNFSYSMIAAANRKLREDNNALQAKLDELQRQEPVAWTEGPNAWKDWCGQWFGPDSDDSYLAQAVFELPPMAQKFRNAAPKALEPDERKLVRNAAVRDERKALAEVCDAMGSPHIAKYLREQTAAIESLKEPTP